MILYHATKTKEAKHSIIKTNVLLPGRNVRTRQCTQVHLSKDQFIKGSYALDVIGADTNEAWVFTVEIPDNTPLLPDPSDEGRLYNGEWVVHEGPLPVTILAVEHIKNVRAYEMGM